MSSEVDTTSLEDTGRRLERARHSERLQTPDDPVRQLIASFSATDWTSPLAFPTSKSHNRLLLDAAKKSKVVKREVYNGYRVFTRNSDVVGGFHQLTTSLTSDLAKNAMASRPLVKKHLEAVGVPTPPGRSFSPDQFEDAESYFHALSAPATLTPCVGERGAGVSHGVEDLAALRPAWQLAQVSTRVKTGHTQGVHLEQRRPAVDICAYVVGETVICATALLPLFIIGDGRASVRTLADQADQARSRNAYLAQTPPDISTDSLAELGLDPSEVLDIGEIRDISGTSDPSRGGMTLDVTAKISDPLRRLAVDALWALPGLRAGGVYLSVNDLSTGSQAVVTDVSDTADISLHRYPAFGSWHAVASHIVNQMVATSRV